MSDNNQMTAKEQAQQEMQKRRLLKANNVQRRRFERMVGDYLGRALSVLNDVNNDHKEIVRQGVIRDALGGTLDKLNARRDRILSLKRQIETEREGIDTLRQELVDAGLRASVSSWGTDPLKYFTTPSVPVVRDDTCEDKKVGDDALRELRFPDCRSNPLYIKYEAATLDVSLDEDEVRQDFEDLNAKIWQLVTTDEIVEAMNEFKEKWIND